jgi:hypothetical protein
MQRQPSGPNNAHVCPKCWVNRQLSASAWAGQAHQVGNESAGGHADTPACVQANACCWRGPWSFQQHKPCKPSQLGATTLSANPSPALQHVRLQLTCSERLEECLFVYAVLMTSATLVFLHAQDRVTASTHRKHDRRPACHCSEFATRQGKIKASTHFACQNNHNQLYC